MVSYIVVVIVSVVSFSLLVIGSLPVVIGVVGVVGVLVKVVVEVVVVVVVVVGKSKVVVGQMVVVR